MKVGELKALLEDFDDNDEVIIATSDGDRFSPLEDVSAGFYIAESDDSGDFVTHEESEEDEDLNLNDAEPAIALWPTD